MTVGELGEQKCLVSHAIASREEQTQLAIENYLKLDPQTEFPSTPGKTAHSCASAAPDSSTAGL